MQRQLHSLPTLRKVCLSHPQGGFLTARFNVFINVRFFANDDAFTRPPLNANFFGLKISGTTLFMYQSNGLQLRSSRNFLRSETSPKSSWKIIKDYIARITKHFFFQADLPVGYKWRCRRNACTRPAKPQLVGSSFFSKICLVAPLYKSPVFCKCCE